MRDIVVVGGGFGGLHAALQLERALTGRRRTRLTLVSDQAHFLFTPLLPGVASDAVNLSSISVPLDDQLESDSQLVIERVEGVDLDRREVVTTSRRIGFDFLILAPGSTTDWKGHPEWADHTSRCKSGRDALAIREQIERTLDAASSMPPDERRRHLTFVTVGAGATGVELTAELAAWFQFELRERLSADVASDVRFILVEERAAALPEFPAELRRRSHQRLDSLGVEIRIGTRLTGRNAHEIELSHGESLECEHVFWCGGVKASPMIANSGLPVDETGMGEVAETLAVPGYHGIFLVGDSAHPRGATAPRNARAAIQQGTVAAKNVVAALSGRSQEHWSYQHRGDLVSLGRGYAAAWYGGMAIEGKAARAIHDALYAALIPNTLKKMSVLRDLVISGRPASNADALLLTEE